jgi:ectoine hydroxylase-related dioxygenase (phytanoyl-CoA dioxygenase family)
MPGEARNIAEILGAAVIDPELGRLPLVDRCKRVACELLGVSRVWFHFDHVFYKQVGDESRVPWHQDRASSPTGMAARAVHFWIPLQDVSEDAGCMLYLAGSQGRGLQHHEVENRSDGVIIRSTDVDDDDVVACPVGVGGLVCHSPMTIHSSGPNRSGDIRRAWVLQMGVGPWPALRETVKPIQARYAKFQVAHANR